MFGALLQWLIGPPAPPAAFMEPDPAPPPGLWALRLIESGPRQDAWHDVPAPLAKAPPPPGPVARPAPERRLLAVMNRRGSVEHYYHFILGFVAPLLLREDAARPGRVWLVPSCGPLDEKLAELQLDDLSVVPKATWQELKTQGELPLDRIFGFDHPAHYDAAAFAALRTAVLRRLSVAEPAPDPGVLIVDRGKSPDFYQSADAQNKLSANLRRSVPNMPAVLARFLKGGVRATMVELETASLREQVALFAGTRVVVAQHGAALVNMLWMRPGGLIVEILPEVGEFSDFFSALAARCGHGYVAVPQAERHAPVDPEAVFAGLMGEFAGRN
jgi:hypothetical protein